MLYEWKAQEKKKSFMALINCKNRLLSELLDYVRAHGLHHNTLTWSHVKFSSMSERLMRWMVMQLFIK